MLAFANTEARNFDTDLRYGQICDVDIGGAGEVEEVCILGLEVIFVVDIVDFEAFVVVGAGVSVIIIFFRYVTVVIQVDVSGSAVRRGNKAGA